MAKTYSEAGVDIEKESKSIDAIIKELRFQREGIGGILDIGKHFTGLIDFGDYALSICTDGVGTKLLVAKAVNRWDTIGIDCVALNVNDMICAGAEPLAFVDYLAVSKYEEDVFKQIAVGLNKGAEMANITVVGGEFSTIPEIVRDFDLAGTCVGYVRKDRIITGKSIVPGDSIVGFKSTGIHSNGLTLARKVFESTNQTYEDGLPGSDQTIGQALLEPSGIYVRPVMDLINHVDVKGMANITGGGFRNLARMNPDVEFVIDDPFEPHQLFRSIQELGEIETREMYQTFNMGLGFAAVLSSDRIESAVEFLKGKAEVKAIGTVKEGRGVTVPDLGIHYDRY